MICYDTLMLQGEELPQTEFCSVMNLEKFS